MLPEDSFAKILCRLLALAHPAASRSLRNFSAYGNLVS